MNCNKQTDSQRGANQLQRLAVGRLEAAAMLDISPASLDRLVRRGLLKPSRSLRRPLFSLLELQRFLAETRSEGAV